MAAKSSKKRRRRRAKKSSGIPQWIWIVAGVAVAGVAYAKSNPNADMGGQNFGINDPSTWD